jgi:dynein heavy chain 2
MNDPDPRKEYVVQCIISVLNIPREFFKSNQKSNEALEKFLDDQNEKVLQAVESSNGDNQKRQVSLCLGFQSYADGKNEMHFVKTSFEPLTSENISKLVMVSSLRESPVRSLFYSMREVYVPLLIKSGAKVEALEGRLSQCLIELEEGLKASFRRGLKKQTQFDESDLSGIVTPIDEVHFWDEYQSAKSAAQDAEWSRADQISQVLARISGDVDDLNKKSLPQLSDLTENLKDVLDELWQVDVKPPYPERRMAHLLKVISGALARSVQGKLNGLSVWTSSFSQASKHIREGFKVCERWNEITVELTKEAWASKEDERRWTGDPFKDQFLSNLAYRIQEVNNLRSQHDEVLKLLTDEDLSSLQLESCFEPFLKLQVFSYNDYTLPMWRAANAEYEKHMGPVESKVADRLRAELSTRTSNPAQTVRVFQRYQNLLERKGIREVLTPEREHLLTELGDFVGSVLHELETFDPQNLPKGQGLSDHVRKILWVEQLRSKADLAARPLQGFLKDLHGAGKVASTYRKVRQDLKDMRTKVFKDWKTEVESQLNDPDEPIALEMNSRVMDFDTSQQGALKVTYSERLIQLVKEARIFEQMNAGPIPSKVKLAVQEGLKFYRYAVQLKQICNFYNSMSAELLPSQKLMVLNPALAFEQLLNNDKQSSMKKVQWAKLDQLEAFTRTVKDGAERLQEVNRRLRNGHAQVTSEVVQLANISLLRQRDQWKQKLTTVQEQIDKAIVACGCQAQNANPWREHWDHQIFKIMEVQYQFGLESLSENLPEMKADLILTNKQLRMKPPLEDLKILYYKEIKQFISFPLGFKGLEGAPQVYKAILERNQAAIGVVFKKADELFAKVEAVQKSFLPWVVLGLNPDRVQEMVDELDTPQEFELNFKALKNKRKDVDKIPTVVRVDCFTISTAVLKSVIEDQMERLSESLMICLKRRVSEQVKEVNKFLDEALEKLSVHPESVQELGKAQADAKELGQQQHGVRKQLEAAEERNKILRTVSAGLDLGEVQNKFDDFVARLGAFEELAQELRQELRDKMDGRIKNMNSEIEMFQSRWQGTKPKTAEGCTIEEAKKNAEVMQDWQAKWTDLKEQIQTIISDCEAFSLEPSKLMNPEALEKDIERQQQSWSMFEEFVSELDKVAELTWLDIRPRLFVLQDLCASWTEKLKEVPPPRDNVIHLISQQVQKLSSAYPGLRSMTGEPFEKEHWKILFGYLGLPLDQRHDNLMFRDILAKIDVVVEKTEEIKELTARAIGEVTIRDAVMEVQVWFEQTEFNFLEHVVKGAIVPLIKDWKDIMTEVSDKQNLCGSLKDSRFFQPFKDQCDAFEEKLVTLDELLIIMNKVQRKWVYLEPIFGRGALPHEKERFDTVDNQYRQIMKEIGHKKKVATLCSMPRLKDKFTNLADMLDRCQRALNDFLEEKRSAFPRLYFIGDEDLLEILGQSSNPEVIQSHLKKLFAGIATVEFNESITEIVAMKSSLKEFVPLQRSVVVKVGEDPRNVEDWLGDLSNEMMSTLTVQLQNVFSTPEIDGGTFESSPSQLLCLSENIHFTHNIETKIQGGQLLQFKGELQEKLVNMTSQSAPGALAQAKLKSLILDLIHNISVLDEMLASKVQRASEWGWFKQLRYYLRPGEKKNPCTVRMLECELNYSFEYQGNAGKLVHTPLTDKCYLTLMHGMHLGYGGNPYGPAGTGKTESVKALGNCLGRQVLVFNCDEGIDFQAMGRIFVGLVRCGAWGCFDEFNRLLEEQMSAISGLIQVIQAAIKNHMPTVSLLGRDVSVNHNAGIFITLNPATKGYGGRQKLPDNLKQLFRPVAMSVPDNELIAEVMMFSEGFQSAKVCAQKVVSLFLLSRQLLSPQQHYDWGLRALKPILTLAGRLLQETKAQSGQPLTDVEETVLLIKAVRMNTTSKLTFADARRFQDLCSDLFPGVDVKNIEYKELEEVIRETIKEMRLSEIESQIGKMLQFHEACQQRMGVGIVGPSGCGKSTIWKVLEGAYKKQGKVYRVHVMNPKSMARVRLLGHMDHDTREWFDGVLTASARKVIKEPVTTHNWIVCDGDVDPEWVESLNSVLDDNRLLTMPNGERIQFGTNVNFIFETDHLRFASPATISRLNMIFLSEEDVDIKPLISSWIMRQPDHMQASYEQWFDALFYKALDFVYKSRVKRELSIDTTRMGLVLNVLRQMVPRADPDSDAPAELSKKEFMLAVCRGIGGNLSDESRGELTNEVFQWASEYLPDPSKPLNCCFIGGNFARYEPSSMRSDVSLEAVLRSSVLPPLVPTVTVLRDMDLFRTWLLEEQPFIVSGPEGCGKNLLIRHAIRRMQSESDVALTVAVLHCNAQTSSKDVLQKLRQFCSVSTGANGRVYKPKEGRRIVLYMKDINLPTPDKYDTSEVIMFLQQAVQHNGFYDDDLEFVTLEHIQIVASIAPASTLGRHKLAQRFSANVRTCSISYPTSDDLVQIYTEMAAAVLTSPNYQSVGNVSGKLAEAMVDIYTQMKSKFTVDDRDHYLFSPRDLTQWILQLFRYEVFSHETFLEAWAYEACRIFRDRLVGDEAQANFDGMLKNALLHFFNIDIEVDKLVYTSLLTFGDEGVPKGEMKKVSQADFKKMIEDGKKSYEREVKDLPIELVPECMNQLACIDRALAAPTFNDVLIVGRSGSGRRSLLSLIVQMHRLQVFTPAPSKRYGDKEWKRDLKEVMRMSGVEKQHTVLFLEDHHFLKSEFVESINSLLSCGDVPGIWTPEEMDPLLAPLKEEWSASQGKGGSMRTPFDYFVSQVRDHLRIVISMDPDHPHFLPLCAANPALFSCTTVLWLGDWSQPSQSYIIGQMLGDIVQSKRGSLAPLLMHMHSSQVAVGACPRHFTTLVHTAKRMYDSKVSSASGQSTHLQKGLQKLEEVSSTVRMKEEESAKQGKVLEQKQALAAEALTRITAAMQEAAERRQEVERLEQTTQVDQERTAAEKEGIERELAEIQPVLDAAKKAVGSIKPDHLNEIRALKMPPEPIHDVLSGVLRLMGNVDNSWASMRKFLAGSGAIQRILNFDPREISADVRASAEALLKEKANSFDHATIYRVSVAAAPLAKWFTACVRYSTVLVKVAPMEKALTEAEKVLESSKAKLEEYKLQLVTIDKKVSELRTEFEDRTGEAQVLRVDLERANATLAKAQSMMAKMSGEQQRWALQVQEIRQDAELLSTHACLSAAYCTYLGHVSEDIRQQANASWIEQARIEGFDLLRVMSSESELLTWKAQGLSSDRLSQENSVMIKFGEMVPFIVDPNSQVIDWLKQHTGTSETVLQQDAKVVAQLELSVRFGKTIIVQEVDGIENYLFPLLRKDLVRQGPRQVVQIGEKTCDFNEGFRLYLCTRNSNAIDQLPPNASCLVTRINFTVTRAGLEGQLLGATLQHEKPELEHRKSELLQKEEGLKVELAELEKQLLESLADASGDILENQPLLQSLDGAKEKALTISEALAESNRLQVDLDQQREMYRGLATLGSKIFILVRELNHMDHMYRFSLESFMVLFNKVLKLSISTDSVEEKLRQLGNQLKVMILFYVSRSLFKSDRLTFGMYLVRGIMPEAFEPNEWEFFQGTYIPPNSSSAPAPTWCPPERTAALQLLRGAFPSADNAWFLTKDNLWASWASSDKCEEAFEGSVFSRMSAFQRVLLTQAVRPDRLESTLTLFVCEKMGVTTLSPPPLSFQKLHQDDTSNRIPILFVTTPGADPSQELEQFAKEYAEKEAPTMNFHQMAMGGGQNDDALRLIREAARSGDWVCLKNLHLVISWVPLLEKEIKSLEPHERFRCWLTTEPHAKFPPILLETSLKVTYEAPPGVKKNLLRTLESWSQQWFSNGSQLRSQVFFVAAHFHAIMQERRTYIPQGWSKFYEFSQSDLQSACETVSLLVNIASKQAAGGQTSLDWQTLIGVLEQAVYGSRVDNEFDSRLVREYLSLFFRSDILDTARRKAGGSLNLEIPPFDIPLSTSMPDFRLKVDQMPDLDNPASFGMAPNADRSLQRINSQKVIQMLRQLASSGSAGGGDSSKGSVDIKAWKPQLSPLWTLWDTVSSNQLIKLKAVDVRAVTPEDPPVVAFVLMEAAEATRLGDKVSTSLSLLQKAISGTIVSTADIQAEGQKLLRGEVPVSWTTGWPSAPEEPTVFLQGLAKRIAALKSDWVRRISGGNVVAQPATLSDFLRPDVFLNALRQQTARKLSVPIDSLHLVATFEPQLLSDPSTAPLPVAVENLILEGCEFDQGKRILVEGGRNSALTSVLPPLTVAWMSKAAHPDRAVSSARNVGTVGMPIYVSLSREQLIGEVCLHTDSSRQRVLNAAAIFLTETA